MDHFLNPFYMDPIPSRRVVDKRLNIGIVGCGNVAKFYTECLQDSSHVNILGFSDLEESRAEQFSHQFGGEVFHDLEEMLRDRRIDIVVNLTIHHAHHEIISRCLEAGKHVHTEIPLALSYKEAKELVELANTNKLRLSSAPAHFLGAAQTATWNQLQQGRIGTPRLAYAEVNQGRIESWHPNPEPFYEVGGLWDAGIYQITLLTAFFGRIQTVSGFAKLLYPNRTTKEGRPFQISTPDYYLATLEFDSGLTARLSANFYAARSKTGRSLEIFGDEGMLYLGNFQDYDSQVEFAEFGKGYDSVEHGKYTLTAKNYARGVEDLAIAIKNDKPHKAQASHASHVIEVIQAIETSSSSNGEPVEIISDFIQPAPWEL